VKTPQTTLSFVVPVFDERDTLTPLAEGIVANVGLGEHHIVFVDDGSTDGSYEVMCGLHERFSTVDVVRLKRHLGKAAALAAGFARSRGELLFTMDADLQDDPKEIPRFLDKIQEGYDLVIGWKRARCEAWHKALASRIFNRLVARMFHLPLHDVNSGYKLFRREVIEDIPTRDGLYRLFPVLAAHKGYRVAEISVDHHPRRYGRSKFGIERAFSGAFTILRVWAALKIGLGRQRLLQTLTADDVAAFIVEEHCH